MNDVQKNAIREADNYLKAAGLPTYSALSRPRLSRCGEVVAWLSTDCIGERYLCFSKPKDSDHVRPLIFGDTHLTQKD